MIAVVAEPVVEVIVAAEVIVAREVAAVQDLGAEIAEAEVVVAELDARQSLPSPLGDAKAFFDSAVRLLDHNSPEIACPVIVDLLKRILPQLPSLCHDEGFRVLHEHPGGLTMMVHWHPESVWSQPHDHGKTWAIYGQVSGRTGMHDCEDIGEGKVKLTRSYWVMPGEVYYYPIGAIHCHQTYDDAKLIRLEGQNFRHPGLDWQGHYYTVNN